MKKTTATLILLIIAGLTAAPALFAADPSEEETTPRERKIYLEPQKTLLERGKIKMLAAVTGGFDNNAQLNSERIEDYYTQQFFRAVFTTSFDKKTQGNLSYDLMNLMYSDETDLSLVRNTLCAGYDYALNKDFIISPGYTFDSINYLSSGDDDWIEHGAGAKLKQRLPAKMYQIFGYNLSWRDYLRDYLQLSSTTLSDKRRNDWRNTFDYEIGRYFEKDWVKAFAQFYYNNSNEKYLNYWDYNSYKFGASLTHLFNKKVSGYFSGYWQYRKFRTRPLLNDADKREHDATYVLTGAAYYELNKSFTVGLNYTYRQNDSNAPEERYSGSLVSLSAYYRF